MLDTAHSVERINVNDPQALPRKQGHCSYGASDAKPHRVVALFNGVGGGAVALIAWVEFNTTAGFSEEPAYVMNRSIPAIIAGGFGGGGAAPGRELGDKTVRETNAADAAVQMAYANQVVVVPGYGMAVAQAQHTVRDMARLLEDKGVEVKYAIHPVAGRMPGHMNVLLAEADVPYEQLKEMD